MKPLLRFIFLGLFCIFGLAAHADQTSNTSTDLRDALSLAYATNPTLQAARAELRAVDESLAQAQSGWLPDVSGTATYSDTNVDPDSLGSGIGETKVLEVGITQPLFRGGRTRADIKSSKNKIFAQRGLLTAIEQTVFLNTVVAYMDVLQNQKILELRKNNETVLGQQRQAAKDRFDVGEVTRTDVAQAESRLADATANRINAEGALQTSIATYKQVVGTAPYNLVSPDFDIMLPKSLDEAIALANANNPDIIVATYGEKSALAAVRSIQGELLPTIEFQGTFNRTFNPRFGTSNQQDTGRLTLGATIPLYKSGAVRSRIRQAKQEAVQRDLEIEEARRSAQQQAISAWEQYESARASIISRKAQIEASALALEGVEAETLFGSRTVLDVLDAEQEALDAKVNLVIAERDKIVSIFNLLAATGQLTAQSIGLDVERYDPTENYDKTRWNLLGTGIE